MKNQVKFYFSLISAKVKIGYFMIENYYFLFIHIFFGKFYYYVLLSLKGEVSKFIFY